MFETWLGGDMPLPVRFFIAFLVVLALIGVAAWAVRRFGAGRMGTAGTRGRQPRLAVIDQAAVDQRRRLILIRRDNVEHLLMIGGPSDLVVEPNIVRGVAAARDVPPPRGPALAEPLPRIVTQPEPAAWQPEPPPVHAPVHAPVHIPTPAPSPRPAPRPVQVPAPVHVAAEDSVAWPLQPQPEAIPQQRTQRETLSSLADELAARSNSSRDIAPARSHAPEPRIIPTSQASSEAASDPALTDMAQRLESALRRPAAPSEIRAAAARPPVTPDQAVKSDPPRAARPVDARPARNDAKPAGGKSMYESLEQEMASLLGRPASKT